jgi:glycosyltransferase involved in cell wall biosynthesis
VPSLLNSLVTRRAYQVARWDTPWIRRRISEEIERFQPHALHVEFTPLVPLANDRPIPRLLDMHNIESVFAASIGDNTRGLASFVAHRDARLLRRIEDRADRDFDVVLVSSRSEAKRAPCATEIVPNGVHASREPLDVTPDPTLFCFVGVFSWLPNIDGAEWLVREVLPLLAPETRLQIVGRNPHPRVQALAGPRVEVTGEVPDPWPYVAGASVILAPLLSPGGTRLKILEGLLAERPVVATPAGASGLEDLEGEGLVLAESPRDFAEAVMALSRDPERAAELGRAGRRALLARYDWERIGDHLLELYDTRLGLR